VTRIASNAALLWLVRVAMLACSAVLSVLTARFLGPLGRGLYTLPAIDASLGTTFAAGLSAAAAYYLLNRKAGQSLVRPSSIVLSIFIAIGFVFAYATAAASHSIWALPAAGCFTVAYSAYSLAYGFLLGFDRARSAALLNAAAYVLTLILVSVALLWNHSSPGLAVAAWVSGMSIAGLIGLTLVFRLASQREGSQVDWLSLLRFSSRAGLVNLANLLNYRIDIYVVAILLPVAITGLYTLAVTGAESAVSLTIALSQATLPRIGRLEHAEAGAFTARCLRSSILLAFLLALIGFFASPLVVAGIFGPKFISIVLPLRVLLIGLVAASTSPIISNYFVQNRGRTRVPLITSMISTLLCAAISIVLVPKLGMLGAAIGSTFAYICSQTVAVWYFCLESKTPWFKTLLVNRDDLELYARLLRP
jgi:O-antigen/teichoic acid export membrane protein